MGRSSRDLKTTETHLSASFARKNLAMDKAKISDLGACDRMLQQEARKSTTVADVSRFLFKERGCEFEDLGRSC